MQYTYGEDNLRQIAINVIHHELCHVHERHDLTNMIEFQKELEEDKEGLNYVLNLHAMNIFSEYVVPKMAVTTKAINSILNVNYLIEIIEYSKKKMDEEIIRYQDGEIELIEVFYSVQLISGHLMKVLSTLIGELDGLKVDPVKVNEQLNLFMSNYYIGAIWIEFKQALRELDSAYPNWKTLSVIMPLKEVIMKVWNCLGVYPRDTKYGLEILLNVSH